MRTASSIRDLVRTDSVRGPTQVEFLSQVTGVRKDVFGKTPERAVREPTPLAPSRSALEEMVGAGLPGDRVDAPSNPFLSKNPQETARLVREGRLSREDHSLAKQALDVYSVSTGERTMWMEAPEPDVERPVVVYGGAGCTFPNRDYMEDQKLQMRPKGGPKGGSRARARDPEPAYQGAADRLPEHELEYLWR